MRISLLKTAVAAFAFAEAAFSCSCRPLPICKWRTPEMAVFVGRVVQGGARPADRGKWLSHFKEVVLDVVEPFHGVGSNQRQFKLQTIFQEGMCVETPYFQGDTVLVVAWRPSVDESWADGGCTTRRIEQAAWQLETLRNWSRLGNKGMLVGTARASSRFEVKSQPGGKSIPVTADSTGKFRVLLNPGTYLLPNDPKPVPIGQGQCVGSEYR